MKTSFIVSIATCLLGLAIAQDSSQRLNYADFEKLSKENRPISTRDGQIIFEVNAENQANKPKIVPRLFGPQAPLTQRLGFEFEIAKPNNWAEASMKIVGMKDKGRLDDWAKTLIVRAEDISSFNTLSLEIGAVGVTEVRLRLISDGNGIDVGGAYPENMVTISNELKPYKIALGDFKQPTGDWVKKKVPTEQVLKKLTGIQLSVTQVPAKGMVVIDNVAFEK